MRDTQRIPAPTTRGIVLHRAALYDLQVWLATLGRENILRARILSRAHLTPGESVLDVGCGTGTLSIAARRQAGPTGEVFGVDASPEMLARARKKAAKASLTVTFTHGVTEALPFPDKRFDVVFTTLMLHHLPRHSRDDAVREMRRVLKSDGRLLVVDFGKPTRPRHDFLPQVHRHGAVDPAELRELIMGAGFDIIESGALGFKTLQFVLATPSGCRWWAQDIKSRYTR